MSAYIERSKRTNIVQSCRVRGTEVKIKCRTTSLRFLQTPPEQRVIKHLITAKWVSLKVR
jgi:hypothetical protein